MIFVLTIVKKAMLHKEIYFIKLRYDRKIQVKRIIFVFISIYITFALSWSVSVFSERMTN